MDTHNFKIVLINHSFQVNYFSRRWKLFAETHTDADVTLLAPVEYSWYKGKEYSFGQVTTLRGQEKDEGNFHIRTFNVRNHRIIGWDSPDLPDILREISPDIIYHIGTHNMLSLKQVLHIRNSYLDHTRVIAFSMRGPALNLRLKKDQCSIPRWFARRLIYIYLKTRLNYINKNVDAFFCHYPDAVDCFRKEGYTGPIYVQTQVGVNEEWFHEDGLSRAEIRNKYGIPDDAFVFGSATRFSPSKGVDYILNALPQDGNWFYLMMGSGSEEEIQRLRNIITKRGLKDRVIETGFVDWYEIAKYWNAVDCAIHVPITTPDWEETFSLSVVQPMMTKKPIIGSDSGSVPYQIGFPQMIVPEGDLEALRKKIEWVLSNKNKASEFAVKMYERTKDSFEIKHLNDLFYRTLVEDILPGKYDISKFDMANCN